VRLHEVLTLIAWQTGIRVESEFALNEVVDLERLGVPVEAALGALLGGYHALVLETQDATDDEAQRTVWVLAERSTVPGVAEEVEVLLSSDDAAEREEAARRIERRGLSGSAYDLLDRLARAQSSGPVESAYLGRMRDRLRDTLCRAWPGAAVGPQAARLRCPEA
jgi:hypothetical protein